MTLLSPWSLVWLAGVPVLMWIWRFAATRHRVVVSSLAPFEQLLRRTATRRTRLITNLLFWLQLAALVLLALALTQPVLVGRRPRTLLVVIDTSASMGASLGGATPLQQAKRALLRRLGSKDPRERVLLVTTAPVELVTPEPLTDSAQLSHLVHGLKPRDLAGRVSIATRVGQGLLGGRPDDTWILTDEPAPAQHDPAVRFDTFGEPAPNAAIVGIDADEPLCMPAETRLVVTVQNFSTEAQTVRLIVRRDGRAVADESRALEPGARAPIPVTVPEPGLFEATLRAKRDALAVDNTAFVQLRGAEPTPVIVASSQPAFSEAIGGWVSACPKITWTRVEPPAGRPIDLSALGRTDALLVTDIPELAADWPASVISFSPKTDAARVVPADWMVDATHPISEYLQPLSTVASSVEIDAAGQEPGDPVIWGIAQGRKFPLVRVESAHGRRVVRMLFDPTAHARSVPALVVFLNSLRWVIGSHGMVTTGEPLVVGPFAAGTVRVERPDGSSESLTHPGGLVRYAMTDQAGRYRVTQGSAVVERMVDFLDPIESNTLTRVSTWEPESVPLGESVGAVVSPAQAAATDRDVLLVRWLLGIVFLVVAAEWVAYARKQTPRARVS